MIRYIRRRQLKGRRYLGDKTKTELHDLENENNGCYIDEIIAAGNHAPFDSLADARDAGYSNWHSCLSSSAQTKRTNPKVALIAAIVCILFVVFVLVYPGLKEFAFVQGLTGLVVATTIAVVLFTAVPARAEIKGIISLGGAAAFFFIILPRVEPFIFPTYTVTGTIYYVGTTQAVKGVLIRDPDTTQSVYTDDNGDFRLPNVSRHLKKLTAKAGGIDYELELNAEKKYPIIKQFSESEKTSVRAIDGAWEEILQHRCPSQEGSPYETVQLFVLTREQLAKLDDYKKLFVRVSAQGEGDIVHAEPLNPPASFVHEVHELNQDSKTREWWISASDNCLNLKVAVCVGTKRGGRKLTKNDLSAHYWFAKE